MSVRRRSWKKRVCNVLVGAYGQERKESVKVMVTSSDTYRAMSILGQYNKKSMHISSALASPHFLDVADPPWVYQHVVLTVSPG